MSYPYPQDRHRDRRENGEQPYKDAREAMSQQEAEIQTGAEAYGDEHLRLNEEDRTKDLEALAEARLRQVAESRAVIRGHNVAG